MATSKALPSREAREGAEVGGELGIDDVGCTSAEFEGDLLEVRRCGGFEEGASHGPGSGEGEHVDVRVQSHGGPDVRPGAGEHVEESVWDSGFLGQSGEVEGTERGVLGEFDDHRVSGRQRRCDLPAEHRDRVVPGQDGADDADRHRAHPAPAGEPLQVPADISGDEVGTVAQVGGGVRGVELVVGGLVDRADEFAVRRGDEVERRALPGGRSPVGEDAEVAVDDGGKCLSAGVGHVRVPSRVR